MRPARATCRCWAASACRSTTGIATCRPPRPQTWGEQTDVPESADWYNSGFLHAVGLERAADAHARRAFLHRGALQGREVRRHLPGLFRGVEVRRSLDASRSRAPIRPSPWPWGTSSCGNSTSTGRSSISTTTAAATPTCRCWCGWRRRTGITCRSGFLRASDLAGDHGPDQQSRLEDRRHRRAHRAVRRPHRLDRLSLGRAGASGTSRKRTAGGGATQLKMTLVERWRRDACRRGLPLFRQSRARPFQGHRSPRACCCATCRRKRRRAEGRRGAGRDGVRPAGRQLRPRPRPRRRITCAGLRRERALYARLGRGHHRRAAAIRSSPSPANSPATPRRPRGKSMVILGAGINHWYHMDMTYRGIINMLVMCGCVGQSGGGWSHYVGQEKLRPQTGWLPLAFALDWNRPPRQMNATSYLVRPYGPVALRNRSASATSCRPPRRKGHGTAASSTTTSAPSAWAGCRPRRSLRPIRWNWPRPPPLPARSRRITSWTA